MALPLYKIQTRWFDNIAQYPTAHPGLQFDKFVNGWDENWRIPEGAKKSFYDAFERASRTPPADIRDVLNISLQRIEELVNKLKGASFTLSTDWRLVSGLGTGHPYETGFIWHRTLGVPYLPGSSIKGLVRSWAEQWTNADVEEVKRLFGPKGEEAQKGPSAGSLIIFDALPVQPPRLEVDIMNPHYMPYYQDPNKPPADYYNPNPVFFLTVAKEQRFSFAIAPRPGKAVEDVSIGKELLRKALTELGAGGKTAVGYGLFKTI